MKYAVIFIVLILLAIWNLFSGGLYISYTYSYKDEIKTLEWGYNGQND